MLRSLWSILSHISTGSTLGNWLLYGPLPIAVAISVMWSALSHLPLYLALLAVLIALMPLTLVLICIGWAIGQVHRARWPKKDRSGRTFLEAFNHRHIDRNELWRGHVERYRAWRAHEPALPETLTDFVNQCNLPRPPSHTSVGEWVRSNHEQWESHAAYLLRFAQSIYSMNADEPTDMEAHKQRAIEAKFWDCWVLSTKNRDHFTHRAVCGAARSNRNRIILLAALELAHDAQTRKRGRGKSGLYSLTEVLRD